MPIPSVLCLLLWLVVMVILDFSYLVLVLVLRTTLLPVLVLVLGCPGVHGLLLVGRYIVLFLHVEVVEL